MSVAPSAAVSWWNSLTNIGQVTYRGLYHKQHGHMASEPDVADWAYNEKKDLSMQFAKQAARSGIDVTGKKIRIVFKKGRDLNVFNVQTMNVDGQWWRITDGDGHLFVVDPGKVNYTETK